MIVTFFGHKDAFLSDEEKKKLTDLLRSVLEKSPDAVFYLGDYGNFDYLCNSVLKELQKVFPLLRRIFVTPYLDPKYSRLKCAASRFDEVLYPFTERVPPRFAIHRRNRWMVDNADFIIACIDHDWGGAIKAVEYALQRKKPCVNLGAYSMK